MAPLTRDADRSSVIVVALSLALLTLGEVFLRLAISFGSPQLRELAVSHSGWFLAPSTAIACIAARPLGWRGIFAVAAAMAVSATMILRFRGVFVWPGTFDYYWLPRSGWMLAAAAGAAIGGALLWPIRSFPSSSKAAVVALFSLGVAVIVSGVLERVLQTQIDSLYPPTRFVGLGLVLIVLSTALYFRERTI